MTSILRWGLLSTARINAKLIPAIQASRRSSLTAVASRSLEKATQYAAEWKIPHAFGSYNEMLSSDTIDAVYISLPNDQHAEWTVRALQAGKHVLCEKPFALSVEEVDRMVDAAHVSGRVLAEAFMYLHHPQTRAVLQTIRSGRIGDIRAIQGAFHFSLSNLQDPRAIPAQGGGSIWDVGVYPISYIQQIMRSTPSEATGWQHVGPTGVDMTFAGQLRYANGSLAQFTSSFESPHYMRVSICGSDGRVEITRPFAGIEQGHVDVYGLSGDPERLSVPEKYLYLGEIEDIESAALDNTPQLLSLAETRGHISTVLALLQSARENRPVACGWSLA